MAKSATAVKRRKKNSLTNGAVNKAEAIREVAKQIGKKVRPKDVIAALAAKGIEVSSAQVSSTLKAAGYKRNRRAKQTAAGRSVVASDQVSLQDLLAAKAFASKLGGIDVAKRALDFLAKLG